MECAGVAAGSPPERQRAIRVFISSTFRDGGPALAATLYSPAGIAVSSSGDIYFTDEQNADVRKIDGSGVITTVAGNGNQGYTGDGGHAVNATLETPAGLALDGSGNLYIANSIAGVVRKITP